MPTAAARALCSRREAASRELVSNIVCDVGGWIIHWLQHCARCAVLRFALCVIVSFVIFASQSAPAASCVVVVGLVVVVVVLVHISSQRQQDKSTST